MEPKEYLESLGIKPEATVLITCIDGVLKNPDIGVLLENYAAIKIKELELKVVPGGGLDNFFEKQVLPVELDVFGRKIIIEPLTKVVTVSKRNDNVVELKAEFQHGGYQVEPIDTVEKYNKTADEFIYEFHKLNHKACKSTSEISFSDED